jgi:uncharacterized protein (DUF488 family)
VSSATRRWDLALPADEFNKGPPVIFTVGHGTRPIEEFLAILGAAGIRRLVDVRVTPASRRHPQFGQDALAASLEARAIKYAWRKDLGGRRAPRPDSPHVELRNGAFRGYADHMQTEGFRSSLSWLIDTSRDVPTSIMCAESLWWRCHRRMISDALTVAGCEVVHLLDERRREPHRLNPIVRIDGSRLIYDVGAQQAIAP